MFGPRRRCPKCGWFDIRRSGSGGFADAVMRLFLLVPYRCRICRNRFYRFPGYDS